MSYTTLLTRVRKYRKERGWVELDPGDIAKSIMMEAAELLEHYQWDATMVKRGKDPMKKDLDKIGAEAADILIYLIQFCEENNLDLIDVAFKKLDHIEKKYPAKEMKKSGTGAYLKAKREYRKKG